MNSNYKQNIAHLYIIKLSKWFMLTMPIVALFYRDNGLDNSQIYTLQAVYSLSVALLEIPSGYLADIIGRKKSIVAGSILGTLGFLLYSSSESLYQFMAAEIILGFGGSFISGSDSALLYDSLAADKKEQLYLQYEGRVTSLGNFAETIAAVCGGLLAAYLSYRSVYFAQTLIAALAIPSSFLLREPPRKRIGTRPGLSQILLITKSSLLQRSKLQAALLFSSITGTATLCMAWTAQVYFVEKGFNELEITPLWVILNLATALIAAYAEKATTFLGKKCTWLLITIYIPVGYIFLGILPVWLGLFSLFLFYLVRGYATPVLKDLINKNCTSDVRATVLSIRSLIIRLSFSLIGPFIGYINNSFSFTTALCLAGIIFLLFSSILSLLLTARNSAS